MFLEILQISQKNTFARASFLIKLQVWGLQLYKKRDWHRCFPVNFVKFLRTPFFKEHFWWLLLGVLRKFAKCTGKYLCQSLFLIKGVLHGCFAVNFVKFLSTPFFHKTPLVAASTICRNSFHFLVYYFF